MRFDLSDDQRRLQDAVSDYLAHECPLLTTLAAHEDADADRALFKGLMGLGLGGVAIPEALGGMGLKMLDLAIIAEIVGRFAAPGRFFAHMAAIHAIVMSGDETVQRTWLTRLASGEALATIALGEGNERWFADEWQLCGEATLTGSKLFVPNADEANIILVGLGGGRLGLVEAHAPGLSIRPANGIDAGRPIFQLDFDETPFTRLSGDGERVVDAALVLLTADAFGGATHCVEASIAYAMEREQFGRKIGAFQALKHQLADMALEVEPAVGLFWYAAFMFDEGSPNVTAAIALAKAHITEIYADISRRMIEAHGGIGYTWEFAAHVWLKRALFNRAYLGMPRRHRARYATLQRW